MKAESKHYYFYSKNKFIKQQQMKQETLTVRPHTKFSLFIPCSILRLCSPCYQSKAKSPEIHQKSMRPMGMPSTQGDFQKIEHKVLNNLHANEKWWRLWKCRLSQQVEGVCITLNNNNVSFMDSKEHCNLNIHQAILKWSRFYPLHWITSEVLIYLGR